MPKKASAPPKLTPPDVKRCQAERQETFLTLGGRAGRPIGRCKQAPIYIAREKKPGPDGLCGSMSLCKDCADVLKGTAQGRGVTFETIQPRKGKK